MSYSGQYKEAAGGGARGRNAAGRVAVLALLCLAAAPAADPAVSPDVTLLNLPVPGACISSPFGLRRAVGPLAALFHNGVDLPAAAGTWVVAAAAGEVAAVRRLGSSGLEVDIAQEPPAGGLLARYAHLGSIAPALAAGRRRVAAGERIGRVGRSGVTTGTHLHFELHRDGLPIDPAPFLHTKNC